MNKWMSSVTSLFAIGMSSNLAGMTVNPLAEPVNENQSTVVFHQLIDFEKSRIEYSLT